MFNTGMPAEFLWNTALKFRQFFKKGYVKKNAMRDVLESFYFCKKKVDAKKEFSFYFIKLSWKRFFYKRI